MKYLIAAISLALATPTVTMATEQNRCAPREMITERLASKYKEEQGGYGIISFKAEDGTEQERVIEQWVSATTGTFTFIMTNAEGISCIVSAGTDWESN